MNMVIHINNQIAIESIIYINEIDFYK